MSKAFPKKQKRGKRFFALLLALILPAALTGCGQAETSPFRELEVLGERRYSLICRLNDRIAPQLDAAMEDLAAAGTLSSISIRWLGRDAIILKGKEKSQEAEIEAAEGAEALPSRVLILGVEDGYDPMAFATGGALQGMSVDIGAALGEALGWEVRYQPISPGEIGTQLASGNIDCALGFDPGEISASKYTVGVTYLRSEIVLAARRDTGVKRLRDLEEKTVGTTNDPMVTSLVQNHDKLTKFAAGATIYLTPRRCVEALNTGLCAAVAMDRIMLEHVQ